MNAENTVTTAPNFTCPTCRGAWTGNYTFDHAPECRIGQLDAETKRADMSRLQRPNAAPFPRDATDIELELLDKAFGISFDEIASFHGPGVAAEVARPARTLVCLVNGEHYRAVAGFDPNSVAEQ